MSKTARPKRRLRPQGQLIPKGDGRYLVRVYLGRGPDGKRKYSSKTVKGISAARKLKTKMQRDIDTGTFVEPSKQTLNQYLDAWLAEKLNVTDRTQEDYAARLRRYVRPQLGHKKLDQVNPQEIQKLYRDMEENGLSPRSIQYTHTILKQALRKAVAWRYLPHNPAEHVTVPKKVRREMNVLSTSQVNLLLEVTKDDPLHALWAVLLCCGLRPQEAQGLKWSDIDGNRLRIQRSLVRGKGYRFSLSEPKTAKSRRTVLLLGIVTATLERHRIRQKEQILAAGSKYKRDNLVFTNSRGRPLDQAKIRREFKRALETAGLPEIRLYDTRHTHMTHLLEAGVNPKVAADRAGHATVTLTLDTYSHVLPEIQENAVERLEALLAAAGTQ